MIFLLKPHNLELKNRIWSLFYPRPGSGTGKFGATTKSGAGLITVYGGCVGIHPNLQIVPKVVEDDKTMQEKQKDAIKLPKF